MLEPLLRKNFLSYATYVVLERALPELLDGLKPVQRRLLHVLKTMDDGRLHKVANVVGETMKLHPHGDASIYEALVTLANKGFLIERQGNFGNVATGHRAAAARYIECRLTPLAREALFDDALTELAPSYDGRSHEPVVLPSLLPLVLMLGAEGIAVGMNTRILPHQPRELLEALIARLSGKPASVLPDFPGGGEMDASAYDDGRGVVRVRAVFEEREDGALVLRELPYGTTTESVIASIEEAAREGKLKVEGIDDFTAEAVEIVVRPGKGVPASRLREQLFACTQCQVTIASSIVVIHGGRPVEASVGEVLDVFAERLLALVEGKLRHARETIGKRHHWLTLERLFIEHRVYRRIEEAVTAAAVKAEVVAGLEPFAPYFVRPLADEDVLHLLDLPLRRISTFDLEKSRKEEARLVRELEAVERKLANLRRSTIAVVRDLLDRHGQAWRRRTRLTSFESVDRAQVAHRAFAMSYDPATGFFGTKVRGPDHRVELSAYDRVLAVCAGGWYAVLGVVERTWLQGAVIHLARLDAGEESSFVVVYQDPLGLVFAKRVRIPKGFRGEGSVVPDEKIDLKFFSTSARPGLVQLVFDAPDWQRTKEGTYSLNDLPKMGPAERGVRLAPWRVKEMKFV